MSGQAERFHPVLARAAPIDSGELTWPAALPGGRGKGIRQANRVLLIAPQELDGILPGMVNSGSVAELVRRTGAWEEPVRAE